MSGFSADWLALREPADHAARDDGLVERLRAWLDVRESRRIVDLGCGTGSNLRYLLPRLGDSQHWRLVDHDRELLKKLPSLLEGWCDLQGFECRSTPDGVIIGGDGISATITTEAVDLAGEVADLDLRHTDVVTASALLDLCSAGWIDDLAGACVAAASGAGAACLFLLDYDGRASWHPALDDDDRIRDLVNRHQVTDKGFGAALGPGAAGHVEALLRDVGHDVQAADSVWHVGPDQPGLHHAFVDGWAEAAAAIDPASALRLAHWLERRHSAVDAGATLAVGHRDVLGLPR